MIDEAAITSLVDSVADQIDRPISDGSIDESGLYPRIVMPHDGLLVDRFELNRRVNTAIASGADSGRDSGQRHRHDRRSQATGQPIRRDRLAGHWYIRFQRILIPERTINVRRAAELIDGTLVGPGEAFSFNQALGSITAVGGFVPAGATEGGIPGTSVGGGVCQVSTTLFRAALKAGLPITEWYPHVYRSTFYEQGGWAPGFDASIQQPDIDPLNGPDLKFRNDTDGWLLVRVTATAKSELKVTLFGKATGFNVVLSDPLYRDIVLADQTPIEEVDDNLPTGTSDAYQPARDGVTMVVHRTVYAADGTILSDEDFVSTLSTAGTNLPGQRGYGGRRRSCLPVVR